MALFKKKVRCNNLIFNFFTAQAQLRCFHCQDCKDPFETENAPSQLCSDTIPPTGLDSSYLGMEVPHTEQTPIKDGVGSEIELRQKRDIAEKNIVYNCYTITEGLLFKYVKKT